MKSKLLHRYDVPLNSYDFDDPHGPLKFWAAGYYSCIQRALRYTNSFDELIQRSPNVCIVAKILIEYASNNGLDKNAIKDRNVDVLYRGIENYEGINNYKLNDKVEEPGFIATTTQRYVAESFAKKDGLVLEIDVDTLDSDVKAICIDETIDEFLLENEFLLLPGFLKLQRNKKTSYKPNNEYINKFRNMTDLKPQRYHGGGYGCSSELQQLMRSGLENAKTVEDWLRAGGFGTKCAHVMGMHLVFWRAVLGRKVDIFGRLEVPEDPDEAKAYLKQTYRSCIHEYDRVLRFIPEYNDLIEAQKKRYSGKRNIKINSYHTYCAVYNPKTNEVLTIHFKAPRPFFAELFDMEREDLVKDAIKRVSVA